MEPPCYCSFVRNFFKKWFSGSKFLLTIIMKKGLNFLSNAIYVSLIKDLKVLFVAVWSLEPLRNSKYSSFQCP